MDIEELKQENERLRGQLAAELARTDALTGLLDRSRGMQRLKQLLESLQAHGGVTHTYVLVGDIDKMKALNAESTALGDFAVSTLGATLREVSRELQDVGMRYGGDEGLVLYDPRSRSARTTLMQMVHANQLVIRARRAFQRRSNGRFSATFAVVETKIDSIDTVMAAIYRAFAEVHQSKTATAAGRSTAVWYPATQVLYVDGVPQGCLRNVSEDQWVYKTFTDHREWSFCAASALAAQREATRLSSSRAELPSPLVQGGKEIQHVPTKTLVQ